jgi:tetratricopeptide (TPR) repeat protein
MDNLETEIQQLRNALDAARDNPQEGAIQDLEEQVQSLMSESSGGEHYDDVVDLYKEVSALRREYNRRRDEEGVDVNRLLSKANLRINISGTPADHRAALRILRQVLDEEPANETAYELLDGIIEAEQVQTDDILEVVQGVESQRAREVRSRLDAAGAPSSQGSGAPPPSSPAAGPTYSGGSGAGSAGGGSENWRSGTNQDSPGNSAEVERLQARMTQVYYEGDYQEAINLCLKILSIDENNTVAKEYRVKAEDYLDRGVVPDARIPREARFSYNRALSLKRAGQYSEAESLFRKALDIAKTEGGIDRWSDAERELMEIDDLILQKELVQKGDRLARNDEWDEAAEMYQNAMNVVGDPNIEKKHDTLTKAVQIYRQVDVKLSMLTGQLTDQAKQLQPLRNDLAEARGYWPNSAKLMELMAKIDARTHEIGANLQERGENFLHESRNAVTVDDRLRRIQEGLRSLEAAGRLLPDDGNIDRLIREAQTEETRAERAKHALDEAEDLINHRNAESIEDARELLMTTADDLSDFTQGTRYRNLLSKLQRYILEEVDVALNAREPDVERARDRLEVARSHPFTHLGHNAEIQRISDRVDEKEEALRRAKRWKQAQPFAIGIVALLVGFITIRAARPVWHPVLYPPTSTPTSTPTATLTPTITPTPTDTPTPTNTPTPSPTTASRLCQGITKSFNNFYVYEDPDRESDSLGIVNSERWVDILDQTRDKGGELWFKIDYGDNDTTQVGWIPAEFVSEEKDCPRLP